MKSSKKSSTLSVWPKFLGMFGLAWIGATSHAVAQTYSLSNTFSIVGITANLDASANNRGMCYYAASNMVIVNNKGTHTISTYDGAIGTSNGIVNNSGLSGGNFTLNKIGSGTDGVLYGASLTTSVAAGSYKLYQWTNISTPPNNVYSSTAGDALLSNLGGKRVGDSFAITGGGASTKILAGVVSGSTAISQFVLLSTADGVSFTPTVLTVPAGLPTAGSGVQFGIAFYTNNTFLVNLNGGSGNLYLIQYPANFASLSSPVTATVLATNTGLAGNWVDMSYNAAAGLLATHANATTNITLYSLPSTNFPALASITAGGLSFSTSTGINGNETGDVALGGAGLTNAIYTLDTSAGLQATAILFTAAAIPPSITTQPTGGSVFTNVGSFSFSVAATGTLPLAYQWQFNTVSNQATASNIPGATNASYTLSPLSVANSGWYDVVITNRGGVTSSVPVQLTVTAPISSFYISNLWSIAPSNGSPSSPYPFLDSASYDTRGLAYDTNTSSLLVADEGTDFGIWVLDANNGTNKFQMNTLGVGLSGDQFNLDQVGVADDGVLYACNLFDTGSTASTFIIYSWSSVNASVAPAVAYPAGSDGSFGGDPSASGIEDRWGDTMAVRGAGVNTEILLGSYDGYLGGPSTNACLMTTSDGLSFNSTLLTITNAGGVPAGFCSLGIAFGAGNTFWAKSPGYNLRQIAFDPLSGNCTILQSISTATNGAAAFSSMSAICLDVPNNLLAGITFNDVPNDLSLFILSATTNAAPYMFDQAFFPSNNGNSQNNGSTVVKYPRIYSLDVNNGIVALSYSVPLVPFTVTSVADSAVGGVVLTWQSVANHTYQVQFTSSLSAPWTNLGAPIVATSGTTTYNDTGADASMVTGYYRVLGH